jgi:hypothetical protein
MEGELESLSHRMEIKWSLKFWIAFSAWLLVVVRRYELIGHFVELDLLLEKC